jgi:type I restriction enzyme S subunit
MLQAGFSYRSVGVKWYGEGLHVFESRKGHEFDAARFEIRANDLIYNDMWARKGSVAIVSREFSGCVASAHFPTFELNHNVIEPQYLHWFFKTHTFWDECESASRGSTGRNQIKRRTFLAIPLPLPSLDEQRRIVKRIERANDAIAEVRHLVDEIDSETEAFIVSMHLRLAGNRRRALHDILKLDEDVVPVLRDGFYPQVGIKSFGVGLFRKPAIGGTDTTYRNFNRLYEGAVVLSQVKGWEGAVAVCPSSLSGLFVSPEYRTFRCRQGEASSEYLSTLVRLPWFWRQLSHATRGAGARRERTRPEQFLKLQMPMPDSRAQSQGVSVFSRMEELRVLRRTVAPEMSALLPSILDRAFKGEL